MEVRTPTDHRHGIRCGASLAVVTVVTLAACSSAGPASLSVADWCWLHYRRAPVDALRSDAGPPSPDAAHDWVAWLMATADAPDDLRAAHDRQRELVERFASTGSWTNADRAAYVAGAHAEPTPATVCETVGARIVVDPDDGTLPVDWELRFLDPHDPAYSALATRSDAST